MDISINMDDPEPLFAQLREQIKAAVVKGFIKPGDSLPSIRQLANDLNLNSKTVAKAYRLLERDQVIVTKGYRGTFVHQNAQANSTIDLAAEVQATIDQAVAACRALSATDSEIRIAFSEAMQAPHNS